MPGADLRALKDWFAAPFAESVPLPRTVGREAEYPVVTGDGEMFEAVAVMPEVLDALGPPLEAHPIIDEYDGQATLCGVRGRGWALFVEGGRGTIEVTVGPAA